MYQRTLLDNGLPVLTSQMPHTRSVSMAIFVRAGSRYESDEIAGVSHFLEHLLFKGTKNWPTAKAVSEALEGVGGVMNASTDKEITVFWFKVPAPYLQRGVSLLADMMLNPLLDPLEVDKEREVVLEELRMTNDYPTNRVDLLIDETLWPGQRMGRDVGGSPESVSKLVHGQIRDYVKRQYNSRNAVVAIAGDIDHGEVTELVLGSFGQWATAEPLQWQPVQDGQSEPRARVEHRNTEQAHLCIGLPGLPLTHPDRYALGLLNVMLGEGMSSRLFQEIREKQGLAYDVHSSVSMFQDCGALTVYCGVEPRKTEKAIGAILEQLKAFRNGVPHKELVKAKELTKGRMLLRLEDSRSVAMWMGSQETLLGKVRTVDEVVEQVDAVSTRDIKRVAGDLIREDRLNLAVVGPYRSDRRFQKLLRF